MGLKSLEGRAKDSSSSHDSMACDMGRERAKGREGGKGREEGGGESRDAALCLESNNKRTVSMESFKKRKVHTVFRLTLMMVQVSFEKTMDARKGERARWGEGKGKETRAGGLSSKDERRVVFGEREGGREKAVGEGRRKAEVEERVELKEERVFAEI